jgi:hypothetical protein
MDTTSYKCSTCNSIHKTKFRFLKHKKMCSGIRKNNKKTFQINNDIDDCVCKKIYKTIDYMTAFTISKKTAESLLYKKIECEDDFDATLQYIYSLYSNKSRYTIYLLYPYKKLIYYIDGEKWMKHKFTEKPEIYIDNLHKTTCLNFELISSQIYPDKPEKNELVLGVYDDVQYFNICIDELNKQ